MCSFDPDVGLPLGIIVIQTEVLHLVSLQDDIFLAHGDNGLKL